MDEEPNYLVDKDKACFYEFAYGELVCRDGELKELWRTEDEDMGTCHAALLEDTALYLVEGGRVAKYDTSNGKRLWQTECKLYGRDGVAAFVIGEALVVRAHDMYSFSTKDGKQIAKELSDLL